MTCAVAGYFGGFGNQGDNAYLEINFLSSNGSLIDQFLLGPVTPADRSNQTGLFLRSKTDIAPIGTRTIELWLHMEYESGTITDGHADNLTLTLTTPIIPPPPTYKTFLPFVQKS